MVSNDLDAVRALLQPGRRRRMEAEAQLRPYEVIENNLRDMYAPGRRPATGEKLASELRHNSWEQVFPLVAGLVQTSPDGIPIALRIDKRSGLPIQPNGRGDERVVFKYAKPEARYPYPTADIAAKLGITNNKFYGLVAMFRLRERERYSMVLRLGPKSKHTRYSHNAFRLLQSVIEKEGINQLWAACRRAEHRNPADYDPSSTRPEPIKG